MVMAKAEVEIAGVADVCDFLWPCAVLPKLSSY